MDTLSREERIKNYAYTWWELKGKRHGHDVEDYLKAEHIVDGEDKAQMREDERQYAYRPSRKR